MSLATNSTQPSTRTYATDELSLSSSNSWGSWGSLLDDNLSDNSLTDDDISLFGFHSIPPEVDVCFPAING
jgi:hypothetical protein